MMFWRSVVGKLWFTILLLVSFILFILSITILEFFQNYSTSENEKDLTNTAEKIAKIVETHTSEIGLEISWEIIDDVTSVTIIKSPTNYLLSESGESCRTSVSIFWKMSELVKVMEQGETKRIVTSVSNQIKGKDQSQFVIIGVPLKQEDDQNGAVFIYQNVEVGEETTSETTKFILLAAGVAIILTTIFAFFLSTRITAPLRKMREAAFEVARGKFDTKVPILTHDEIGELATAFNQMGRQLKFNMNALKSGKRAACQYFK